MLFQVFLEGNLYTLIGGMLAYHLPSDCSKNHGNKEAFCRLFLNVFDILVEDKYTFAGGIL